KWKVLARDLELFLENWKGRIPITMYFSVDLYAKFYFTAYCMEILNKYEDNGVLKKYNYYHDNFYLIN
ncbi:1433_t:CDS:1, partial [Funneliformis geosporum]